MQLAGYQEEPRKLRAFRRSPKSESLLPLNFARSSIWHGRNFHFVSDIVRAAYFAAMSIEYGKAQTDAVTLQRPFMTRLVVGPVAVPLFRFGHVLYFCDAKAVRRGLDKAEIADGQDKVTAKPQRATIARMDRMLPLILPWPHRVGRLQKFYDNTTPHIRISVALSKSGQGLVPIGAATMIIVPSSAWAGVLHEIFWLRG